MRRLVLLEPIRLLRESLARLLSGSGYEIVHQDNRFDARRPQPKDEAVDLVLTELPGPGESMAEWIDGLAAVYPNAQIVILTSHKDDREHLASAFEFGAAGYLEKDSPFEAMEAALDAVLHGQVVYPCALREDLARFAGRLVPPARQAAPAQQVANGHGAPQDTQPPGRNGDHHPAGESRVEPRILSPMPVAARPVGGMAAAGAAIARHAALPPHGTAAPTPEPRRGLHSQDSDWLRHKGLSDREAEILRHVAMGHANKVIANRLDISEATVKSHIKSVLRKLDFQNRTQAAVWAHSHAAQLTNGSLVEPAE